MSALTTMMGMPAALAMTAYRCNQLKPVHMRQMEIGNDGGDLLVVILEQSKRIFRIRKENNVDTGNRRSSAISSGAAECS